MRTTPPDRAPAITDSSSRQPTPVRSISLATQPCRPGEGSAGPLFAWRARRSQGRRSRDRPCVSTSAAAICRRAAGAVACGSRRARRRHLHRDVADDIGLDGRTSVGSLAFGVWVPAVAAGTEGRQLGDPSRPLDRTRSVTWHAQAAPTGWRLMQPPSTTTSIDGRRASGEPWWLTVEIGSSTNDVGEEMQPATAACVDVSSGFPQA